MKTSFLTLLLWAIVLSMQAQDTDSLVVSGKVFDYNTRQELEDALVEILTPDSALVGCGLTYNTVKKKSSDPNITFMPKYEYTISVPRAGNYLFRISAEGHEAVMLPLTVATEHKKQKYVYMEDVLLKPQKDIKLGEAVVKASRIMMVMKGDTIVYNADAFQLADGSMLDNLIEVLPGVEVRPGGRIYVNGRYVNALLLNGRDFFKGDPSVALKNLPAYVVKNIKAYEKEAADAYLLPEDRRDEAKEFVVDVNLKKQYMGGWLINGDAGYGVPGDRYMGRLFGMRFTDLSHLAVFFNANNLNDTGTPNGGGDWSSGWTPPTGVTKLLLGGINYALIGRKSGAELNTSLKMTREDIDGQTHTAATTFLPTGDVYRRQRSESENRQTHIVWNATLDKPQKDMFLKFYPSAEYVRIKGRSNSLSAQFSDNPVEAYRGAAIDSIFMPEGSAQLTKLMVNQLQESSTSLSESWNARATLLTRVRVPFLRSPVGIQLVGNYNKRDYTAISTYDLRYSDGTNDLRLPMSLQPSSSYDINFSIDNNIPFFIGNVSMHPTLRYRYKKTHRMRDREYYRLDWADEAYTPTDMPDAWNSDALPSMKKAEALDVANSYHTVLDNDVHTLSLSDNRFFSNKRFSLSWEIPVSFRYDRYSDLRGDLLRSHARHFVGFAPRVDFGFFKDFRISYSFSNRPPAVQYLVDVRDDANPLYMSVGNPNLKASAMHDASFSYMKGTTRILLSYSLEKNAVAQSVTYNAATGAYTYQPRNINGNWSTNLSANNVVYLNEKKTWNLTTNTYVGYHNSVDFVDDGRSSVRNFNMKEKLSLRCHMGKVQVAAQAQAEWIYATSERENYSTRSSLDLTYGVKLNAQLPCRFNFDTDISMLTRRGYDDKSMNDDNLVWNASLSRRIDRKGRLIAKVEGFDILRQLKNVRRTLNVQGIVETWYNVVPAYTMLHIIWMFNTKKR